MIDPISLFCIDGIYQIELAGLRKLKYAKHEDMMNTFWVQADYADKKREYMAMNLDSLVKLLVRVDPTGEELIPIIEQRLLNLMEDE